ncbi:hypothetical protein [Lysinibacillus piscis]|uniref:Lipoprotein n=1 Tax=Lysinibacillus piscis TaxID=2518931 RepID=A0ABQ5NP51_9BACI|nr:hypothetical protein [Lysinibacillus sp. KH24]GLC90092.1 hypothetical protein LYSBPC_32190 [Lysinibacillus sp. KH24]
MFKKVVISGVIFSSIILVGCNEEQKEAKVPAEVSEGNEKEADLLESNGTEAILNNVVMDELLYRITEKAAVDKESVVIMLGSSNVNGNREITCSIAVPKESKIDDVVIEQIVEDIIKTVSKTENAEINEDNIEITYTNGEVLKGFNNF